MLFKKKTQAKTVSLWEFAFNYFGLGFFVSFAEVLSHTVAAAIVNYSAFKTALKIFFVELSQPLCIDIAGAVSGHCWLQVQLQFSEQTFYFSGLL